MSDNPSNIVHQLILNNTVSPSDLNAELLPEIAVSTQYLHRNSMGSHLISADASLQDLCTSSSIFYGIPPRLPHDLPDFRASIQAVPDNGHIQNVTFQWPASSTGQISVPTLSSPNVLEVSYWNRAHMDGLITEHYYPTSTMPTVSQLGPLETEISRDHSRVPLHSSRSPTSAGGLSTSQEGTSTSLSQMGNQSSSRECYAQWKRVPVDAIIATGSRTFVPQTLYKPFTNADKERYLEQVSLSPPIIFETEEPLEWGISLEDVRGGRMQHLVDASLPVLQNCGPSVSIRINWPGYSPFKRQISSRNWHKVKGPTTKRQLAQRLAKTTGQFIEKMSNKSLAVDAETCWRVGNQYIKVEDLILVSLHHVSKGSWQPQFRLRRDIV